jgi:hypothetical protein
MCPKEIIKIFLIEDFVASKDDNWAGKYVFDLRSLTTQQRLTDPRHNLADFYYTRIPVLITYKLADLFTQ